MNLRAQQQGTTLLELIVVLVIMTSVVVGAAALVDTYTQNMRLSLTAQQMSQFGNAVQTYIKDNYTKVDQTATATVPLVITVADLKLLGTKYLPANFSEINSYQQSICALVLQPTQGTLNALVVTEGGKKINDLDLGQLAGLIGATGGGIYRDDPPRFPNASGLAYGTMGKWIFNISLNPVIDTTKNPNVTYPVDPVGQYFNKKAKRNCSNVTIPVSLFPDPLPPNAGTVTLEPGHPLMALWFSSDTSSAYLYRDQVPGHRELNQMNTNLTFNPAANGTLVLNNIQVHPAANSGPLDLVNIRVGLPCGFSAATNSGPPYPAIELGTLGMDASLDATKGTNGSVLSCQSVNGANVWQRLSSLYWAEPVNYFTDLPDPTKCVAGETRIVKLRNPLLALAGAGAGPRAYTCDAGVWQALAVDEFGVLQLGTAATENSVCFKYGLVTTNSFGQLMSCQDNPKFGSFPALVWVKPSIGNYSFRLNAVLDPNCAFTATLCLYRVAGTGTIDKAAGTFTGTLICDPASPQPPSGTVALPYTSKCGSAGSYYANFGNVAIAPTYIAAVEHNLQVTVYSLPIDMSSIQTRF